MPNIGDSDDDWAELARELSRDKPQPPSEQPTPAEEMGVFGEGPESTPLLDEEGDELPEGPGETDADNIFRNARPGTICGNVGDSTGLPISSVELELYLDVNNNDMVDAGDVLVATAFSDGDTGNYCFEDITPGEYVVVEIQPVNYNSVSDYDHTTPASDTDGDDSGDGADDESPGDSNQDDDWEDIESDDDFSD